MMNPNERVPQFSRGDTVTINYNNEHASLFGIVDYVQNGRDDAFTPYYIRISWLDEIISRSNSPSSPFFVYAECPLMKTSRDDFLLAVEDEKLRISAKVDELLN